MDDRRGVRIRRTRHRQWITENDASRRPIASRSGNTILLFDSLTWCKFFNKITNTNCIANDHSLFSEILMANAKKKTRIAPLNF